MSIYVRRIFLFSKIWLNKIKENKKIKALFLYLTIEDAFLRHHSLKLKMKKYLFWNRKNL